MFKYSYQDKYICCYSTMAPFIHCDINQASMGAGPVVGNRSQRSSEDPCRTIARAPVAGCSPKNWLQSSVNPFCPWRQVLRLLHWMHQQMATKQVIKGRGKITCKGLQSLQYCNNIVSFQGVFFYFALWVTRFAWAVLILNHVLWDSCWVVDCLTRWSLWYWYLDFYVDHHISIPRWLEKYSTAMC